MSAQAPTSEAAAAEVIVTGQRSGIPVRRVTGPKTKAVLVGTIERVTPDTRWDPVSLDAALTKADSVMFPEAINVGGGLFTLIGAIGNWRKQASLPTGQTLQIMTTATQWARLVALRNRRILKPGFERRHPYHSPWRYAVRSATSASLLPGPEPTTGASSAATRQSTYH